MQKNSSIYRLVFILLFVGSRGLCADSVGIVDFGAKLGSGFYGGDYGSYGTARVDRENDGTLTNDFVHGWPYSATEPLNPDGLDYDTNTLSGVFYGGLTLYTSSDLGPRAMSEGHINQNHEFKDDFNIMTLPAPRPNEMLEAYAVYYWPKKGFLNGGANYTVRFETNSAIAVDITRYWAGVNAGRWLARDGDQFYLSEDTFAGETQQFDVDNTNENTVVRNTHIIDPTTTRWAEYTPAPDPAYPFEIDFDPTTATFADHTFTNVTAIGFFVERYLSEPHEAHAALTVGEPISVKWGAVRAEAVVNKPASPSCNLDMGPLASGADMSSNSVPYQLWRNVFRFAQRRQMVKNMGLGTYSFEKDGAMGTMRADDRSHHGLEPVTDITWLDAVTWCNALSEFEGLEPCYYTDPTFTHTLKVIIERDKIATWTNRPTVYWNTNATGFRLPTSAEWSEMTPGMKNTSLWEYVWFPSGAVADPSVQTSRTALAWGLATPTESILQFNEYPWQGSPRITFRPVRGATPLFGSASGTTEWNFTAETALPPTNVLSAYETRAVVTQLLAEVTLDAGLANTNHIADLGFNPFESIDTSNPYSVEFGATEIPYRLWNFVQQWGMQNGYEFNYSGDMGSMGNTPDSTSFSPDEPVTQISYYDILVWCNALSEIMEREPVFYKDAAFSNVWKQANKFRLETCLAEGYPNWPGGYYTPYDTASYIPVYMDIDATGYRVPLPQEWELVNATDANSGTDAYNWTSLNSSNKTHPAGTKLANPLGLYDMEGNVRERTWGDTRANINRVMHNKGSHFARGYQDSHPTLDNVELPSVGRVHIGFRTVRLTAPDPMYEGIAVSTTAVQVAEGSTAAFQIQLSDPPSSDTTVIVSRISGDTDISVQSGAALVFSPGNWNVGQTVVLAATEDADGTNSSAQIRCSANGIAPATITATEQDNDASLVVSSTSVTVDEGSSTTIELTLTLEPTTPVTVTVERVSGDTDLSVSGNSSFVLNDQNWDQPQTLTIAAAEDADQTEGSAVFRCSSPGIASPIDITATEIENDFSIVATGLLAAWNLDSVTGSPVVTSTNAYFMATGLVHSVLTHSDTSLMLGATTALKAKDTDEASIADAIADGKYFYWQIEPQDNYLVTVTSIVVRTDTDSPTEAFVLSDASGIDAASTLAEHGADHQVSTVNLSGQAEFEQQTDPVEFRVYGYKADNAYRAVYIGKKYYADGQDDIRVYGTVVYSNGGEAPSNRFNLIVSPSELFIAEASSATLSISLSEAPVSTVTSTVQRTSGDSDVSVSSGSTLVFTTLNWSNAQTAVIQAAADPDRSNSTAVITIHCDNADPVNLTATEQDDDYVTRLTLSTNTLQSGISRLGINLSENYWDSPMLSKRTAVNFEGVLYRQCHQGELCTNGFATYWISTNTMTTYNWNEIYTNGGTFQILSGEAKGTTGSIVRIETRTVDLYGNGTFSDQPFFIFDQPLALSSNAVRDMGILIENNTRLNDGYLGENNYWKTPGTSITTGDKAPGSFGTACAVLDAASNAVIRLATQHQRTSDANGDWRIRFWARKTSGSPSLAIDAASFMNDQSVALSESWQQHNITVTLSGVSTPAYPDGDNHVIFELLTSGSGTVHLDDIEVFQCSQTNATPFTDEALTTLRDLNPGWIRNLRMGGSSVTNAILPRLRQFGSQFNAYTDTDLDAGSNNYYKKDLITLHELALLCEEIGSSPWFCLPGGIYGEEVSFFVDYLAGSTNTAGGQLRAELGHPTPWTDVFDQIHVEFGNEAWNMINPYLLGGFNGADYWHDLIAEGKSTPSYTNSILFTTAGQNFETGMANRILSDATNSDRYAIAPYMIHSVTNEDMAGLDTDVEAFRWFMAYPLYKIHENGIPQQYAVSTNQGVEYSIYEYNYHFTTGDTNTLAARQKFAASPAHGISIANTMLAMMRDYGIRNQCMFSLHEFDEGDTPLFGASISKRSDMTRHRPVFLTMQAVNSAMAGDMIQVTQSADNPSFSSTALFDSDAPETKTYNQVHSYSFKDGTTNSLIVFNYDLLATQQVEIALSEYVQGETAAMTTLSSPSFDAGNEPEFGPVQVALTESTVTNLSNGSTLAIPPASVITLTWQSDGEIPQLILSTNTLVITEGTSQQLTLNLSSEPAGVITVNVAVAESVDADFTLTSASTMLFDASNWSVPQTAAVAAAEDAYGTDGHGILRFSADGYADLDVALIEQDDDPSGTSARSGSLLIDFGVSNSGKPTTDPGWNNVTTYNLGVVVSNLVSSNNLASGISLEITDAFESVQSLLSAGVLSDYPESAQVDCIRVINPNNNGTLVFSGFATNETCHVRLLSSQDTQTWRPDGQFTVNGNSQIINSYTNNSLNVWSNVSPTAQGTVEVNLYNNGETGIAIINLIQIDYAAPVETEDTDSDGMPDWWEDLHGFGPTGAVATNIASNGVNTLLQAYIAGLDPTDANAQFRISDLSPLPSVVRWNAAGGRVYSVYWTSNLLHGFQLIESNLTSGVYTDTINSAETRGFYRIEVKVAP